MVEDVLLMRRKMAVEVARLAARPKQRGRLQRRGPSPVQELDDKARPFPPPSVLECDFSVFLFLSPVPSPLPFAALAFAALAFFLSAAAHWLVTCLQSSCAAGSPLSAAASACTRAPSDQTA